MFCALPTASPCHAPRRRGTAHVTACAAVPDTRRTVPLDVTRRQLLHSAALLYTLSSAGRLSAQAAVDTPEIRAALAAALTTAVPANKAPSVLRLAFHDAGTYTLATGDGGPNGSVVFELDRPESFGLKRGVKPVLEAQRLLVGTPAASVSLADLIQVAGAHAVQVTGGPAITVPLGRLDVSAADPTGRMPPETMTAPELIAHFASAGFTTRELVALAGAHTIGGKGFGAPLVFDNTYYKTLLAKPWSDPKASADDRAMASHIGLPSDHALPEEESCLVWVEKYAADQGAWLDDFSAAYVKMGCLGAQWGAGVAPPAFESRA